MSRNARLPFARNAYQLPSLPLSAQRCINLYAEQMPPDSAWPWALFPTPGVTTFATCGEGPIRAMHVMASTLYVVSGAEVYKVGSDGAATLLGSIAAGSGKVWHASNNVQLVLVEPKSGRAWSVEADAVSEINDPDFPGATSVTYLDGYFIFTQIGAGRRWFWSDILAAGSYDALAFATAESGADALQCVIADHREIWLFAGRRTEIWTNTGADPDLPFERMAGAYLEKGTVAPGSVHKVDNSIFWLGGDGIVYRANGYNPARISTHAIERAIAGYASVADAWAWSYAEGGHTFYVLHFPGAATTWVYDAATQLWHERETGVDGAATRWRWNTGATVYGRHLVGDSLSGRIGWLRDDTYTEIDAPVRRLAATPPLRVDGNRFRVHGLTLEAEAGVGLAAGQGSDPQVMLRYSRDGGATWGPQLWRSLGRIGERERRARWHRLGQARSMVFEVEVADPVKVVLYGLVGWPEVDQA